MSSMSSIVSVQFKNSDSYKPNSYSANIIISAPPEGFSGFDVAHRVSTWFKESGWVEFGTTCFAARFQALDVFATELEAEKYAQKAAAAFQGWFSTNHPLKAR